MGKAWAICPRCPTPVPKPGPCPACRTRGDRERRPTGNPYTTAGHRIDFRENVLAKHPRCVCTGDCGRHVGMCAAVSTVADHHPIERRDLELQGLNPNDPKHGRGLCKPCHDGHTARTSPGGWAAHS